MPKNIVTGIRCHPFNSSFKISFKINLKYEKGIQECIYKIVTYIKYKATIMYTTHTFQFKVERALQIIFWLPAQIILIIKQCSCQFQGRENFTST